MNYYIQGDAAKADKIKAAFEKLGYDTSFVQKLSASDSHILFTLPCDTRVHAFHTAYIEADILKRLVNIDPDYKELELPIEPKFKVGDKIRWINHDVQNQTITDIKDDSYITVDKYGIKCALKFIKQDEWELISQIPHYDISNFHAGMPVLVRDDNSDEWNYLLFSHYRKKLSDRFFAGGSPWYQCVPFDKETKHLLGTTDMPSEEYINW